MHDDPLRKPDSPRVLQIAAEHSGQRIDNYLLRELRGVPRSRVYRILRRGEIRINGARVRPDYRLQRGDALRLPPLRTADRPDPVRPPERVLERLREAVLYEDDQVLAVDKPSGLAVHKGSGLGYGLIEALRLLRPRQDFLELVHRLDRDTSGCLLLAKTPEALRAAHVALRSGAADKRYLALVRGPWRGGVREVDRPLSKNVERGGERLVVVDDRGKSARTRFAPLRRGPRAVLVEAVLETGRTHQIRVHAASLQHPLAGDAKYGDPEFNRWLRGLGLRRLFLHASRLCLRLGEREVRIEAALGQNLEQILRRALEAE